MTAIILDVDPGVDDALAVMFALNVPEFRVLGLSVVSGNVPVDRGVKNALGLLQFVDCPTVPVFAGAERPLHRDPARATHVHGPGGLGAASVPASDRSPDGDAVDFIVETLGARAGQVTLVAMGPTTNLALAETRAPGILKEANQIVLMGGCIRAPGNVTPVSEFNFYSDPHAARIVLQSQARVLVVPLDVTTQVTVGHDEIRALKADHPSEKVAFFEAAANPALGYIESLYGEARISLHDPVAIVATSMPQMFDIESQWLDVETQGEITTGQLIADRRLYSDADRREGVLTNCCVGVDASAALDYILKTTFASP